MTTVSVRGGWFGIAERGSWLGLAAVALLALSNCAAPPPPPPPPTVVKLQLQTTSDANGVAGAVGAPLVIRVYQLASGSAFQGAEFFPLYKADAATLGPDLIKKDEVLMAPSSTKAMTLTPPDAVHTLGVFAAYGSYAGAIWRVVGDIPAHQTTNVTVTADSVGLKMVAVPVPVKPASP